MYKTENVRFDLFLKNDYELYEEDFLNGHLSWFRDYQSSFQTPIILDRHYLYDIENTTRIASVATKDCNDNVQLILARNSKGNILNFRELPVSLLRLYFLGRYKFDYWLHRLPISVVDELHTLLVNDGYDGGDDVPLHEKEAFLSFVKENGHDQKRNNVSLSYVVRLFKLRQYLILVFDTCFSSFERSLHGIITFLLKAYKDKNNNWPSFGLFENLQSDDFFQNVPNILRRKGIRRGGDVYDILTSSNIIWLVIMWRMNVTIMIEAKLKPWLHNDRFREYAEEEREKDYLTYKLQLFRDTHLDLLTEMCYGNVFEDETLKNRNILYEAYPSCHRICDASELPDLTSYAFENLKKGTNLKERCSLKDKIGHLFLMKAANNICKIRNLHKIIARYGKTDPILIVILIYVTKCVMLGNLPKCKGRMNLAARLRINYSFYSENTDKQDDSDFVVLDDSDDEYDEDDDDDSGKRKKKKKKKKKKESQRNKRENGITQATTTTTNSDTTKEKSSPAKRKSVFITWVHKYRHLVSFILKEYSFYTMESTGCFNEILGCNNKYRQYTNIGRIALGRFRDEFSSQCSSSLSPLREEDVDAGMGLAIAIDWTKIEHVYKLNQYTIKTGIILNFHTLLLKTAQKVKKDAFINILIKKMTGSEEEMNIVEDLITVNTVFTLEEFHFIAWYMANYTKDLETQLLKVIGMTEQGVEQVRGWQFCYYIYDIPDDSLKDYIVAFQERSMSDYILLKSLLKLITYYKRDHVYHLPYSYGIRQIHALRKLLDISDHSQTPNLLGTHYECTDCNRFSNPIVYPVDYFPYQGENSNNKKTTSGQNTNITSLSLAATNPTATSGASNKKDSKPHSLVGMNKRKMKNDSSLTYYEQQKIKVDLMYENTLPSLNSTLFNVYNGQLYCARKPNKNNRKNAINHAIVSIGGGDTMIPNKKNLIMKSLDNSIIIETNKAILPKDDELLLFPFKPPTTNMDIEEQREEEKDEEEEDEDEERNMGDDDDDDDEDEDDTIIRFDHDNDISNIYMLNENHSKVELFLRARAQSLIPETFVTPKAQQELPSLSTNQPPPLKAKRSNKMIINKFTNDPISKYFSCQLPLNPVYMVGIIKCGKVLCVNTGAMTIAKNFNMTSYGFSSMRRATPSHTKEHPVWDHDKKTVLYKNLKVLPNYDHFYHNEIQQEVAAIIKEKNEEEEEEDEEEEYEDTLTTTTAKTSSSSISLLCKKSLVRKRKIVDIYHSTDIINESLFDEVLCSFCKVMPALIRIAAQDSRTLRIMKMPICNTCKKSCKTVVKNRLETLEYILNYLSNKRKC